MGLFGICVTISTRRGALVAGDARATELDQLFGGRRAARTQHDARRHLLAAHRVGRAVDGGLTHRRVRVEHVLDLRRIDVEAGGDDHVLQAVADREVAVVVAHADVAGVKPAVTDRLRGVLGTVPVAEHDVGSANHDLAPHAALDLAAVLVHHLHLDAFDRLADRAQLVARLVVVAGEGRGLGEAVALPDLVAEALLPGPRDLLGQWRRRREAVARRGEGVRASPALSSGDERGRHAEQHGGRAVATRSTSSACSITKRRCITMVAPARRPLIRMKFWPKQWNSGRNSSRRSRGRHAGVALGGRDVRDHVAVRERGAFRETRWCPRCRGSPPGRRARRRRRVASIRRALEQRVEGRDRCPSPRLPRSRPPA